MERKSEVWYYPSGLACPHCVWVANDPGVSARFRRDYTGPFAIIPAHPPKDFLGLTIIDSHNFFKNTFNCVNGVKGGPLRANHDFHNIGSLLYGSTIFIESLHQKFGLKKIRLLINSHFNVKKHGGKEHPHALITLSDEDELVYEKKIGKSYPDPGRLVADKPYPDSPIVKLTPQECAELIRAERKAFDYITAKIRQTIKDFDPVNKGFYLFLTYECQDNRRPGCGVINGEISVEV